MNTPTDRQLKFALAKELPELIEVFLKCTCPVPLEESDNCKCSDYNFFWRDTKAGVTDREWDWVVNEVISNSSVSVELENLVPTLNWGNATWQQRAIAYFKTVGKEI